MALNMIRSTGVCTPYNTIPTIIKGGRPLHKASFVPLIISKTERIALINIDLLLGERMINLVLVEILFVYSLLYRL